MPIFSKKWKITFTKPIGQIGDKFELEDWVELHKRISSGYAVDRDKRYVVLESKIINAIHEAAEFRQDYKISKEEFQITDRNGKPASSETYAFLFLKGEAANLQLLLKHVKEQTGTHYEIVAVGDKKIENFIRNSVPSKQFMFPINVVLSWIGKWTTDAFTGKTTGLFIHAGLPLASEPIVYLATSVCEIAE